MSFSVTILNYCLTICLKSIYTEYNMRELGHRLAGQGAISLPDAHPKQNISLRGVRAVNEYEIDEIIGSGRSAQVASARNPHGEQVALKFFTTQHYRPHRLRREVNIHRAAQEVAPHIVPLVDFDIFPRESDSPGPKIPYMVMDKADESVQGRIRRGKLGMDAALNIVAQSADGLGALHAACIVHSDIKPENLLMKGNTVLIADFGGSIRQGLDTVYNGSVSFAAPEQVQGTHELSPAADQYALGGLFVALTNGKPLFPAGDWETYERIVTSDDYATQVATRTEQAVPRELQGPVRRALRQNPDDRFPSVTVFAQELLDRRMEALGA